jgi:hypothetical protein
MNIYTVRFAITNETATGAPKPDAHVPGDSIGVNEIGFIIIKAGDKCVGIFPGMQVAGVYNETEPSSILSFKA